MRLQENLSFVNLEQVGRAVALAMFCDIPVAIWGGPGIGKSSKVKQIARRMGIRIYDFRLSDKDKADLGGIPMPKTIKLIIHEPDGSKTEIDGRTLEYLVAQGLLPFDTDEVCIVLFDEADRTDDPGVRNAVQQLWLDRTINGHVLSPNARIVIIGNGTSDIDTTPLSRAANGRMIHLYVENTSPAAMDSWLNWANTEVPIDPASDPSDPTNLTTQASGLLINFAKHNPEVWKGNGSHQQGDSTAEKVTEFLVQAEPTNRTWVYADTILRAADSTEIDYRTDDVLEPLVAGCVGKAEAMALLDFRDLFLAAPTIDQILADPMHVSVPERIDILSTLTYTLTDYAAGRDRMVAEAFAKYGMRWTHEEPKSYFMRRLLAKNPTVLSTDAYMEWQGKTGKTGRKQSAIPGYHANYLPDLAVIFPEGTPEPDNKGWINRFAIPSKSNPNAKPYILSQDATTLHWLCSCPGWINGRSRNRTCEHINRLPATMKQPDDPSLTAINAR